MSWRKKYTRPLRCGQPSPRCRQRIARYVCVVFAAVLVPNFAAGQAHTWTYSADAEKIFGNGLAALQTGAF